MPTPRPSLLLLLPRTTVITTTVSPLLPVRLVHHHPQQTSRRLYSTPSPTRLINLTDLPAPNSGRIRVLSLNRPAARNAISKQLLAELRGHVDAIAGEYTADGSDEVPPPSRFGGAAGPDRRGPTRALIVASDVDSCFCAGADLKERAGFSRDETDAFLSHLRATFAALAALPIPTISAVASPALGGGLELALCTHLRVLASTATVALPETRLAIIPGAGGTYRLPGLIGLARARDLILTGRRVSGPEAYFLGIADRLVEIRDEDEDASDGATAPEALARRLTRARERTLDEAIALAADICRGGPVAVRAALQAVAWAREEMENKSYERVVGTSDRDEALRAFREKRRPVFMGK
ncbi:MAG: hypothetical protein M1818_003099 [Claussenomyces sp. TS43310]|nr:MAG: hypothetical protein M1818_003099 [Claussenomyces sp. TS43310]